MAETNKSQLMSEAEIIEAINADSLISVSLGAGQPQKNVKMSTLASVAAGLLRIKNLSLNHTDDSVSTSNSITMAINQYVVNLIVVGYAYNGSLAAYLAIGGKLHILVNNLPTAVSCTLSANQFIISTSSGNYGITVSILNL